MTRLQNTPYDRLEAPGSLSETQARANERRARMSSGGESVPAARLAAVEQAAARREAALNAEIARLSAALKLKDAAPPVMVSDPALEQRAADLARDLDAARADLSCARAAAEKAAKTHDSEMTKRLSELTAASETIADLRERLQGAQAKVEAAADTVPRARETELLREVTRLEAEVLRLGRELGEAKLALTIPAPAPENDPARERREAGEQLMAAVRRAVALMREDAEAGRAASPTVAVTSPSKPKAAPAKGKPYAFPKNWKPK